MRGTKDTGAAFLVPTYLFIGCLLVVLVQGAVRTLLSHGHPVAVMAPPAIPAATSMISLWLLLKVFASGCAAMTGVEAVSNGVNAFRTPTQRNAKRTLTIIILLLMPPLLFAAGWQLSWREFRANLGRILALAVGLVLFTIAILVFSKSRVLPGFDTRSAILLGAIVGATDAVAAMAIAKRFSLPRRIVDELEAESLVNDGTGLLAFQFGLAIVLSGHSPSVFEGNQKTGVP